MKQAWRACELAIENPRERVTFLQNVARYIAETPLEGDPASYCSPMYHQLARDQGIADPFAEIKKEQNALALRIADHVEQAVRKHSEPLQAAARIAGAGNLIDSGIGVPHDVEERIIACADTPFTRDDSANFFREMENAKEILFIHDNSGEIVMDRIFIQILKEHFPKVTITACVKESPILNDALIEDARIAGIDLVADRLITTGSNMVGAPMLHVGQDFLDTMDRADLFISKGQGNFETLSGVEGGYCVLTAKCVAVADAAGVREGEMVFTHSANSHLPNI